MEQDRGAAAQRRARVRAPAAAEDKLTIRLTGIKLSEEGFYPELAECSDTGKEQAAPDRDDAADNTETGKLIIYIRR